MYLLGRSTFLFITLLGGLDSGNPGHGHHARRRLGGGGGEGRTTHEGTPHSSAIHHGLGQSCHGHQQQRSTHSTQEFNPLSTQDGEVHVRCESQNANLSTEVTAGTKITAGRGRGEIEVCGQGETA